MTVFKVVTKLSAAVQPDVDESFLFDPKVRTHYVDALDAYDAKEVAMDVARTDFVSSIRVSAEVETLPIVRKAGANR